MTCLRMRLLSLALAVTMSFLSVTGGGASYARAGNLTDDIPGTPWTGRTVSGTIGAEVVDRVWSLQIDEGRVGVFRLVGEAGAQLGLYLFTAGTTSVVTGVPIRSSAKPGGSQNITVLLPAGSYYINVNGRNTERRYQFNLSVSLLQDSTPPFMSVTTQDGKVRFNSPSIPMRVFVSDELSGVDAIRWRVNNGIWGEWLTYTTPNVIVDVPAQDSTYTIDFQARNNGMLLSDLVSVVVVADYTAPIATRKSPINVTYVGNPRPIISYLFNEPMDAERWRDGGLSVTRIDGARVRGTFSYDVANKTGSFRPSAPLRPGATYLVEADLVADRAGNVPMVEPWSFSYRIETALVLPQRRYIVDGGDRITFNYEAFRMPRGSTITLDRLTENSDGSPRWVQVRRYQVPMGTGLGAVRFIPDQNGEYILRFAGTETHQSSMSRSFVVKVRPTIQILQDFRGEQVASGESVSINALITPGSSGDAVLIRYRCKRSWTQCVEAASETVSLDDGGELRYSWSAEVGYWAWRLSLPQTETLEAVQSALIKVRVVK